MRGGPITGCTRGITVMALAWVGAGQAGPLSPLSCAAAQASRTGRRGLSSRTEPTSVSVPAAPQ